MPIDIIMPALSPTMTAGTLAKWLKKEGDAIKSGDAIAEIETDKATMEVEATDDGILESILVQGGSDNVKVGTIIGKLREEGEAKGAPTAAAAAPSAVAPPPVAPKAAAPLAEAAPAPATASAPPAAKPAEAAPAPRETGPRIAASPLARRLATEKGLDWHQLTGSGPHGRIVKADVLAAGSGTAAAAPKTAVQAPAATTPAPAAALGKDMAQAMAGGIDYELIPHTNMRRTVARRLTESKQSVPHFYLTVDCEIDRLLQVRKELNEARAELKLSVNDFVIRAAALALGRVPEANSSWSEDGILRWQSIDISVAVAIEGGLITPIVKQADKKGIASISVEMRDLAARARTGKLKLDEFQGGTFSISNLGMYGIREFAAIINPPQGCILAVGAGEARAVVKNGALAVATVMSCTLSVDHRVVDGAAGATFLKEFKSLIENPLTILV